MIATTCAMTSSRSGALTLRRPIWPSANGVTVLTLWPPLIRPTSRVTPPFEVRQGADRLYFASQFLDRTDAVGKIGARVLSPREAGQTVTVTQWAREGNKRHHRARILRWHGI